MLRPQLFHALLLLLTAHLPRRTQEYMARLGVLQSAAAIRTPAAAGEAAKGPPRKRSRVNTEPAEPTRRSGRLASLPAENDGAAIDERDSDSEGEGMAGSKQRAQTAEERDAEARAILDHTREWLAASRAALQQLGGDGAAPLTADGWRAEAVRRWGDKVVATLPSGGDWQAFVSSRLTTPPPPSSLDLLQEARAFPLVHYASHTRRSDAFIFANASIMRMTRGSCSAAAC